MGFVYIKMVETIVDKTSKMSTMGPPIKHENTPLTILRLRKNSIVANIVGNDMVSMVVVVTLPTTPMEKLHSL